MDIKLSDLTAWGWFLLLATIGVIVGVMIPWGGWLYHLLPGGSYPALLLALPVLAQQFLILSVGLYDQFLAGNNIPSDSSKHDAYQAAQTTANYIAWFLSSCTSLVAVGGTALVARFVGAGDRVVVLLADQRVDGRYRRDVQALGGSVDSRGAVR